MSESAELGETELAVTSLSTRRVRLKDILYVVSKFFDVPVKEILSKKRQHDIAEARQVVCWAASKLTRLSLTNIGTHLDLDHTTVIYSLRVVRKRRNRDVIFLNETESVLAQAHARVAAPDERKTS